ncbi:GlxA family transcriptional regulator [Thauera sinica]|uniref:GlxA family transcriptional regulator n=1 Tax=Thauera sinica TaxID=2665146 RepID=A0ABW1ARB7_9RHOO|nr:helix-turn-helix domain-containing protein [Thauera sp. K11]ATE59814.1 AraC family transcriptional regulator [Thauera sp. K11]
MHKIAISAFHGVVPFDLACACEVFRWTRTPDDRPAYEVRVCSEAKTVAAGAFDIHAPWSLDALAWADTIVVPGMADLDAPISPRLLAHLRDAAVAGTRIASICTGAFVLAAAGLLDGRRATTHWRAADELARRHPQIEVDAGVLFVDNGRILTSAGAAAGLDLCLYLVRRDHGVAVANQAARLSVMPPAREGGQAQFIERAVPESAAALQPLLAWLEQNLHQPLDLAGIAAQAATSVRTLSRRFQEQVGTTPMQWLLAARIRQARALLETTSLDIERIAAAAGFGSATALRAHFQRAVGTSPTRYRRTFGGPESSTMDAPGCSPCLQDAV